MLLQTSYGTDNYFHDDLEIFITNFYREKVLLTADDFLEPVISTEGIYDMSEPIQTISIGNEYRIFGLHLLCNLTNGDKFGFEYVLLSEDYRPRDYDEANQLTYY